MNDKRKTKKELIAELHTLRQQAGGGIYAGSGEPFTFYDNLPIGVFQTTPEGKFVLVNTAIVKMLGYDNRDDLIAIPAISIYKRPEKRKMFTSLMATKGTVKNFEVEFLRKDSSTFWASLDANVIENGQNGKIKFEGIVTDISNYKNALRRATESEERYRTFANEALIGIYILKDSKYVFVNPAMTEITGYTEEELLNISPYDLIVDEELEQHLERKRLTESGKQLNPDYKIRIVKKNGDTALLEVRVHPITYEGEFAHLGNILDITKSSKAEKAKRKAEKELLNFLDQIEDMAYFREFDGSIRVFNEETYEITGYTKEDFIKNPQLWRKIVMPEDVTAADKFFEKYPSGIESYEVEYKLKAKSGEIRWIQSKMVGVKDEHGKYIGYNCIDRDVTEHKHYEQALQKSLRQNEATLQAIPDFIFLVDKDGFYIDFEARSEQQVAIAHYAIKGDNIKELDITQEESIKVKECLESAILTHKPQVISYSLEIPNGQKHFETRFIGLNNNEALAIVRDITNQKNAEKEILSSFNALRSNLRNSVKAISKILETRDPYTSGHQERVALLSVEIARYLGLPDDVIEGVRLAALMHDIGKIAVPHEILSKPGQLTNLEFDIIKTHPLVGYEIIADIDFPWPLGKAILQHHERLDGSGYPNGILDEEIILEARILSVADIVEAMSTHRPYRPTLGVDIALSEISRYKNTYFDETIVDACVAIFEKGNFSFD